MINAKLLIPKRAVNGMLQYSPEELFNYMQTFYAFYFLRKIIFVAAIVVPIVLQVKFDNTIFQVLSIVCEVVVIEEFRRRVKICDSFFVRCK